MPDSHTPPHARNTVSLPLTEAAAEGKFELPVCQDCGTTQYPPREICHNCLSDDLTWQESNGTGILLSKVNLHHSLEPYFMDHLPWPTGTVQLDNGAVMITHLASNDIECGTTVEVTPLIDPSGRATLVAKAHGTDNMSWANLEQRKKT